MQRYKKHLYKQIIQYLFHYIKNIYIFAVVFKTTFKQIYNYINIYETLRKDYFLRQPQRWRW